MVELAFFSFFFSKFQFHMSLDFFCYVHRKKGSSGGGGVGADSDAEASQDTDTGDISERTRSAVQRQRKTTSAKPGSKDERANEKKNSTLTGSPAKFKKVSNGDGSGICGDEHWRVLARIYANVIYSRSYCFLLVLQMDDSTMSPFSTPPKSRERLDSSSSSGGTPPTPVSDTCLLVAAAVGHLTDFKFPNTKKVINLFLVFFSGEEVACVWVL